MKQTGYLVFTASGGGGPRFEVHAQAGGRAYISQVNMGHPPEVLGPDGERDHFETVGHAVREACQRAALETLLEQRNSFSEAAAAEFCRLTGVDMCEWRAMKGG